MRTNSDVARHADTAKTDAEPRTTIGHLAEEAAHCRRCPLYLNATQVVFGEGPASARLMLVGEQPGDQEDLAGRPFVGPAGRVLDRALADAGLDRALLYVTNAVKHFKHEIRGKRRMHMKPNRVEVTACRTWFERELAVVRPALVVALGGTAARAVTNRTVVIARERGTLLALDGGRRGMVTIHPSAILRIPTDAGRRKAYADLVKDLKLAARTIDR